MGNRLAQRGARAARGRVCTDQAAIGWEPSHLSTGAREARSEQPWARVTPALPRAALSQRVGLLGQLKLSAASCPRTACRHESPGLKLPAETLSV